MNSDTQEYQKKLSELCQQLIDTLMEIDTINLQANPYILADYAKTIGYLETDLDKWLGLLGSKALSVPLPFESGKTLQGTLLEYELQRNWWKIYIEVSLMD